MCGKNFEFLCWLLFLLIISSSKSQQISTNNEEKDDNLTVRYKVDIDSTANYNDEIKTLRHDSYENFTNDTRYGMQNEFRIISSNDRKDVDSILYRQNRSFIVYNHEDDNQIPMTSHNNLTNVNNETNFTSQKIDENLLEKNDSTSYNDLGNDRKDYYYRNESNIVPYEKCHNITCILLCCPLGHRVNGDECIPDENEHIFPYVYAYITNSNQSENKRVDEFFHLAVYNSCQGEDRYRLPPGYENEYIIFPNGSVYLSVYQKFANSTLYCLGVFSEIGNAFQVTFCSSIFDEIETFRANNKNWNEHIVTYLVSVRVVSMLFLVPIFLVYSILPELRNVHGFILRNYIGAYFITYVIECANFLTDNKQHDVCVTFAFFMYFLSLSANFWLITISFDMWWTFRGFCSLRKSIRSRENRKLMYYAIFAWGCPFILGICCVIMESVSYYLPDVLQPKFELGDCWFHGKETFMLYFYDLRSICIISSVSLSISAALKIARYEKDSQVRLTDSESKRYNDNKKWLNLYLKLFIVQFILLVIQWIVRVLYLFNYVHDHVGFYIDVMDILQHLFTFIIFVCKKKIIMMLLKRVECNETTIATECT